MLREFIKAVLLDEGPFIKTPKILGASSGKGPGVKNAKATDKPAFSEFTALKKHLASVGWPKEDTEQMMDFFYRPGAYRALKGGNNVYIIMPSTSDTNMLSIRFAERLKREFGGHILWDVLQTRAAKQAKEKMARAQSRLEDPIDFNVSRNLSSDMDALQGQTVVLVDDSINTGETASSASRRLWKNFGIRVDYLAVLATTTGHTIVTPAGLKTLSKRLIDALNAANIKTGDGSQIHDLIRDTFEGEPKGWAQIWDKELHALITKPSKTKLQKMMGHLAQLRDIRASITN